MTTTVTVIEQPTGPAWDQWQGTWSAQSYSKLDVVFHSPTGASYIANADTTSSDEPGSSSKWDKIADAGDVQSDETNLSADDLMHVKSLSPTVLERAAASRMYGTLHIDSGGVDPDLGDDFALAGDSPDSYPPGFTTFRDAQGDFPAGSDGIVETIQPTGSANARQLNWNDDVNRLFTRVATSSTAWEAWSEIANASAARIYLGANQGVGSGTITKINLDTQEFAYGAKTIVDLTNNELSLPAGVWRVSAGLHWAASATGDERSAFIRTGSGVTRAWDMRQPSADGNRLTLATLVESAGGLSTWLSGRQDTGGSLDVGGGNAFQTFIETNYVGERI